MCLWHNFLTHTHSLNVWMLVLVLTNTSYYLYVLLLFIYCSYLDITAAVIDQYCGFWGESYSRKLPRLSSITHIMEMSDIHVVHMLLYRVSKIFKRPGSLCVGRFCILVFLCFCSPWSLVVLLSVFVVEELQAVTPEVCMYVVTWLRKGDSVLHLLSLVKEDTLKHLLWTWRR